MQVYLPFFMHIKDYSPETIQKIAQSPSPRVLLNVCTHGDERIGLKVAKYFEKFTPTRGTFLINIANKKAVEQRVRFVDTDLNRVFPGTATGDHEHTLAHTLTPLLKAVELVIDVHSTRSGVDSALIIDGYDERLLPFVHAVSPKRVLVMNATKSSSLISAATLGIAFEYGKDTSITAYRGTVRGIERILAHLYMTPQRIQKKKKAPVLYDVFGSIEKPAGFVVNKKIKNFELVKKGAVIGTHPETNKKLVATFDFYPILFGKNTYKKIFGFCARKM